MQFLRNDFFVILVLGFTACSRAAISLRCKSHCENNEGTDYEIRGKPYACNCEVVKTNVAVNSQEKHAPKKRSTSDESKDESSEPRTLNIFKLRSRNLDPGKSFNLLDLNTKSPLLEKIMEKLDEFKLNPNSEESILGTSLLDYKINPISLPPLEDFLQKHAELVSPRTNVLENIKNHMDTFMDRFDKGQFAPQIPTFSDLEEHVNKINLNMRMDNPLLKHNWGDNPLGKINLFSKFKETEENTSGNGSNEDRDVDTQVGEAHLETTVKGRNEDVETTVPPNPVSKKPRRKFRMKEKISEDGGEPIVIPHVPGIIVQPKEFMGEENP